MSTESPTPSTVHLMSGLGMAMAGTLPASWSILAGGITWSETTASCLLRAATKFHHKFRRNPAATTKAEHVPECSAFPAEVAPLPAEKVCKVFISFGLVTDFV